eukprot:6203255-Pleurochrysis_carterae.AAC.2
MLCTSVGIESGAIRALALVPAAPSAALCGAAAGAAGVLKIEKSATQPMGLVHDPVQHPAADGWFLLLCPLPPRSTGAAA